MIGLLVICCDAWRAGAAGEGSAYSIAEESPSTGESTYTVAGDSRFSLRALIDLRIVRGTEAPSWQEGGPGKLRYGGIEKASGAFERVTRFAIAQLALQPAYELPWGVEARAQLNWDGDVDDRGNTSPDHDPVRIVEAFLHKDWSLEDGGYGVLVGLSNPPFSLEHIGPAHTPKLTLTSSALTSWLWEEGRVLGVEGNWWRVLPSETELAAFGGFGWGPDQQGILVARRGWVMSDFLSGANSLLPVVPGTFTRVFDERDGRPAVYVDGSVSDPWKIGTVHAGFFDNLGNLSVEGVWQTRYGVVGASATPLPGLDLVVQYLYGSTTTRPAPLASTISALYPLVSYRWREHRLTFRYDDFRVRDDDETDPSTRETGHAFTVAYLFEFWLRHRLAVEYAYVDSDRVDVSNPGDDGWQVSYRFRY